MDLTSYYNSVFYQSCPYPDYQVNPTTHNLYPENNFSQDSSRLSPCSDYSSSPSSPPADRGNSPVFSSTFFDEPSLPQYSTNNFQPSVKSFITPELKHSSLEGEMSRSPSQTTENSSYSPTPRNDQSELESRSRRTREGRLPRIPPLAVLQKRRLAANARERKRMNKINSAFERLKKVLPGLENKELSKFESLQLAQDYILHLATVLQYKID